MNFKKSSMLIITIALMLFAGCGVNKMERELSEFMDINKKVFVDDISLNFQKDPEGFIEKNNIKPFDIEYLEKEIPERMFDLGNRAYFIQEVEISGISFTAQIGITVKDEDNSLTGDCHVAYRANGSEYSNIKNKMISYFGKYADENELEDDGFLMTITNDLGHETGLILLVTEDKSLCTLYVCEEQTIKNMLIS